MTKLSPAAQAVLDALQQDGQVIYGMPLLRPLVAAALRAARDEVAPSKTIKDISYVHQSYVDGYEDALDEILAIAIELETK